MIWLLLFASICLYADALDKVIYLDRYGGVAGNVVYQSYAHKMPHELQPLIKDPQCSFEDVMKYAAKVRHKIAEETGSLRPEYFNMFYKDNDNPDTVGRYETPYKYPLMKRLLAEKVCVLSGVWPRNEWQRLNKELELRVRFKTVLEWIQLFAAIRQEDPHLQVILWQAFHELNATWVFDPENARDELGRPLVDTHYTFRLHQAFQQAERGQDVPDLQVGCFEVRSITTRMPHKTVIIVFDDQTSPTYEDAALFFLPPAIRGIQFHWALVALAFEQARHAVGDEQVIRRAIGTFHYRLATAMPVLSGTAALGEWISEALYLKFQIPSPKRTLFSHIDQLAQGSLTLEEFLDHYMQLF